MTSTPTTRTPRPERLYLLDAYLVRLLPTTEIAAECGVHHTTVMRWLAAEGIRFTDAHAPDAVCTPTRYGLLTGRYFWRTPNGHSLVMPYEPPVIEPGRLTLASMLSRQGYRTACIGKWHLGQTPGRFPGNQGFDAARGVHRNVDMVIEPGLYCTGWSARGPSGTIGSISASA